MTVSKNGTKLYINCFLNFTLAHEHFPSLLMFFENKIVMSE